MLAANFSTVRENLKSYCDRVSDDRETVIITRKGEKNIVMISLDAWNEMQKAMKNAEYLSKLDRSYEQIARGEVITKTIAELEAMENE